MFGQEVAAGWDAKLVKWVSCAVNRGVIGSSNTADQGDSSKFYAASGATYNRYAEFFHNAAYTINARAYALAFDDVFGLDSALGIPNKGEVTIQLQAFQ
jgi:imidazole glycerol phosphate synthase subunit HisF